MAKRAQYKLDLSKRQGYVFSLRTAILKGIQQIDAMPKELDTTPQVIQRKEEVVRLHRLMETIRSNSTSKVDLRVGDVAAMRGMRTDSFPELSDLRVDLRLWSIKDSDEPLTANDLYVKSLHNAKEEAENNAIDEEIAKMKAMQDAERIHQNRLNGFSSVNDYDEELVGLD